jgi:hypothetical protein
MKIKVGYADYTVKGMSPVLSDADSAEGICQPDTQTIYIRTDRTPQVQAAALIHELIHACFASFGLPKEGLNEEDVCTKLEIPLANVLRDNPRLPGVLRSALNEGKPIVTAKAAR